MRPSQLKPGQPIAYRCFDKVVRTAIFVRREPGPSRGKPGTCHLRFPDYTGQYGPNDDGSCQVSDAELTENGMPVKAEELRHAG